MPAEPPRPDFTDSDQAWSDRLTAAGPLPPPRNAAEREADLLRVVLARRRARLHDEAMAELLNELQSDPASRTPPGTAPRADGFIDEDQHQRWLQLQARMRQIEAGQADASLQPQPEPDAAAPPPLQPVPAQPLPVRRTAPRWAWGGGALAAAMLTVFVVTQRVDPYEQIYEAPPKEGMRGLTRVQRLDVAQPRQAAEDLHRALQAAGEPVALYQQRRVFIVALQVSSETTPAARAALAQAGVAVLPGPVNVEFHPR